MTPTARSGRGRSDGARIQMFEHSGYVVITIGGELDLLSTAKLAKALETAGTRARSLIIDMTDLAFIDSSGLGILIAAQNRAHALGGSVVLAHPPPLVRRLLTGTQLQHRFPAYDTLDDALAAPRTT